MTAEPAPRASAEMHTARRRRLLALLALLAALAALASPLWLAAAPLLDRDAKPSADSVPTHRAHVLKEKLACARCHSAVEKSESAEDDNLPRTEVCLSCHESKGGPCRGCGRDAAAPVAGQARGRNLRFSHVLHGEEDLTCEECHDVEATAGDAARSLVPAMSTCLGCHRTATCRTCHPDTQRPEFQPSTHDPFWRDHHGRSSRAELRKCLDCHEDRWCQDCHGGDIETRFHDATFRLSHGIEVRLQPARCQSCHLTNFCENCHGHVRLF